MSAVLKAKNVFAINAFEDIELSDKLFRKFAELMYQLAGVDLPDTPKNHALVRNRIIKILRRRGLDSYEAYWDMLETKKPEYQQEFIEALTTNMTSFYRESAHFDFLTRILPEMHAKNNEIRIWCAAASTGQEPYTIAITCKEALNDTLARRTRILATDIDTQVLKRGSVGAYEDRDMQGLPPLLRSKYFDKVSQKGRDFYRAKDDIHGMIKFAVFNLIQQRYEFKNKFHVIFCRNVLIYFDEQTTKKVIENLVTSLEVGGYLILGHSESGNVKHQNLKPLSRAVYQKIG
ncbi:MAG: CheR family methyltransferase [Bdellovibrionia bacterium]